MVHLTDRARAALVRSWEAARRFSADASLRAAPGPAGSVVLTIVDGPGEGDLAIPDEGFRLYVDRSLTGTIDVTDPHETFVLRPSTPDR